MRDNSVLRLVGGTIGERALRVRAGALVHLGRDVPVELLQEL